MVLDEGCLLYGLCHRIRYHRELGITTVATSAYTCTVCIVVSLLVVFVLLRVRCLLHCVGDGGGNLSLLKGSQF